MNYYNTSIPKKDNNTQEFSDSTGLFALNLTSENSKEELHDSHLKEWCNSGVHPDIIRLNVRSLSDQQIIDYLNLRDLEKYVLQQRYSKVLKGGWACSNSVFKPDAPHVVKGKPIKYEFPRGSSAKPIYLKLPEEIWQAIAAKYGIEKPADMDGWDWVRQNSSIPVVVIEGVKKAGAVITSLLVPAIAVAGHTHCYHANGDVIFAEFLHTERTIYLYLDNDLKSCTRRKVAETIKSVIKRLTRDDNYKLLDNPRAKLKICQGQHGKGADDLLTKFGKDALAKIFAHATSWDHWVDNSFNALGFAPAKEFSSRRFENVELPPEKILVGIKAAKGTGKTWYMEQLTAQAKQNGRPVISIVHRIQLATSISQRLNLTYIEDVEGDISKSKTISLVIDSLHKIDVNNFAGGLILIDEVVQVVEHLITSNTCKATRQKILKTLRDLAQVIVESGGQFILSDADLNEATLRYFIGLLGEEVTPYIIQNYYNEPSYKCYLSEGYEITLNNGRPIKTAIDIVATAIYSASKKERILLCVSGQKEDSTYSTINLEKLFLKHGTESVIRVDSETTKNPVHPAYKAASKINEICEHYQVVIASSSIGVGVSIENKLPFDLCCGIFTGVGSSDSVRQFLMRLRDKSVPRLIFVAEKGLTTEYTNLGKTPTAVETNSKELFDHTKKLLTEYDAEWMAEYPEIRACNTSSNYFNELIAARNTEKESLCKYVRHGLKEEGVEVIDIENATEVFVSDLNLENLYEELKEVRTESVEFYRQQIAEQQQNLLSANEYVKLKNQNHLTDDERIALEAKNLSNKYGGIPITQELIAKDADGYYEQLKLHYVSTSGYEVTQKLKLLASNSQVIYGDGSVIRHDFTNSQKLLAQAEYIRGSKVLNLLDKDELTSYDTNCLEVYDHAVENASDFQRIFNQKLCKTTPSKFTFQPIQQILKLLDIQTDKKERKRINGKQVRAYTIKPIEDNRQQIFDAWLERDTERAKAWSERKREWEINKLVRRCTAEVEMSYFQRLQDREIFNDVWERVNTKTRITIINRQDNYQLPTPEIIKLEPSDNAYHEYLADIETWKEISLDIETFGLDAKNREGLHPRKGKIRLIQISDGSKVYYADLGSRQSNRDAIKDSYNEFLILLDKKLSDREVKIIGHNIHFDLRFLEFQYNFSSATNIHDTMKGAQVFFGDYGGLNVLPGGYGLGNLCEKFLELDVDKSEQKSNWGNDLTQSQIDYAVKDPFVTYHLYHRIEELYTDPHKFGFDKLAQDDIRDAWKLENDIIPCAIKLERAGLPIDRAEAQANLEKCQSIQTQLLNEWKALVPAINYTQIAKLIEFLNNKYSLKISSLDKSKLADLAYIEEIKLLGKLRAIKVPIQQLESLLKSSADTGKVQTVFNTLTGTGRFSSGNSRLFKDLPNLQSISAKAHPALVEHEIPSVRSCVKVTGNYVMGIIDLAASHGRIAADVADDETAILGCNDQSIDNHSKVAEYVAKALGHDIGWEEIQANKKVQPYKGWRDAAKNTYYGWLNGAGAKRIQEQMKANSGQIVSIEACEAAIKGCETLYPNVVNFCKNLIAELSNKQNLLHVDGRYFAINQISSVQNRIVHLVKIDDGHVDLPYTQCLAAIWSRTEATALKRALIQIFALAEAHPEWELQPINYVHDEIDVTCLTDYAEQALTAVNNIIGDCFAATLKKVHDGRETNWTKLVVNNWSEK